MKYTRRLLCLAAAWVLFLLCCCGSAAAQAAIEARRPQGKADFSPAYQKVFDFLQTYAASASFDLWDDWPDKRTMAIARHLVLAFPERYPESTPGTPIDEDTARKYVYQFFTPIADTRLGGLCIHLWGEAAAWDYEANALFSLLTEPVITDNGHIIPLMPIAGDLQAGEAETAAELVMKERFGLTPGDLHGMDKFSRFAIDKTHYETEPVWCFQFRRASGIHYGVEIGNKGEILACSAAHYAPPLPEIARPRLNRTDGRQNAADGAIRAARQAMMETGWLPCPPEEAFLLGAVLYDLPLGEGAPMRSGWVVDLFLHGELVGRAAITPDGALAEIIQPWARFTIPFEPPVG